MWDGLRGLSVATPPATTVRGRSPALAFGLEVATTQTDLFLLLASFLQGAAGRLELCPCLLSFLLRFLKGGHILRIPVFEELLAEANPG